MPSDNTRDTTTPLTTAAYLSSLVRETLVSDTGRMRVSSVAREVLLSGVSTAAPPAQQAVTVNT